MSTSVYGSIALVTGASSGIGRATAAMLAKNGFTVYGGSRRAVTGEKTADGYTAIKLDVTDSQSAAAAVDEVISREGRIDVLVNCAGNGIAGAVEDCTGEDALEQMNTNYAGVIRMVRAALPYMREKRSGLIVNIGSVGGIYSIPFQTLYSSSKCALEAMTEGLRIELMPFNVKAALVEPGDIKTGFTGNRIYTQAAKSTVYAQMRGAVAQMEHDETTGASPDTIAREVLRLTARKNPPVRTVAGAKYKFFVFLKRLLPACAVEGIIKLMYTSQKQ